MTLTRYNNARILTMRQGTYELLENESVLVNDGVIESIGDVPYLMPCEDGVTFDNADLIEIDEVDCEGKLISPGFVDCHTHVIFAGDRSKEYEQRLQGTSYADIARRGGGIHATVEATRDATNEQLFDDAKKRLDCMLKNGSTTVEIKSGYGLDTQTEIRMLQTARLLSKHQAQDIWCTYLGAHAIPREFRDQPGQYIDLICNQILPAIIDNDLADAVDAFCETIAFNKEQVEQVFIAAAELGVPVKLHAEQLSHSGGAAMAARYNALSVDHIEYINADDVELMAQHNVVGVLLPGAFYFLNETQKPPIELLRKHQVAMALATDCNPGSSPLYSLPIAMNMGCQLFGMTIAEAWQGVTYNGAKALGIEQFVGSIEVGKKADLLIWDCNCPSRIIHEMGLHQPSQVIKDGVRVI